MTADRWVITFKAHSNSTRTYRVYAEGNAAAHFLSAALRNANWIIIDTTLEIGHA